jgi:hypothetical protein
LMAAGRDASDVALTTSFGQAYLASFFVVTDLVVTDLEEAATPL